MVQTLHVGEPFETSDHQVIRLELVCEKKAFKGNLKIYDYFKQDYNEVGKYTESLNWESINNLDNIGVDAIWVQMKTNLMDIRHKFTNLKRTSTNKCKWVTKRVT